MKVPMAICNLKDTPFDSGIDMEVLGRFGTDKHKWYLVHNPETNRIYEEKKYHVVNHRLPVLQYDRFTVTIREKYQERFDQKEYPVVGYSRDGRIQLQDDRGEFVSTYVSRVLFKEYEGELRD